MLPEAVFNKMVSARFCGKPLILTVNPGVPVGKNSQVEEAQLGNGLLLSLSMATAGTAHNFMIRSHDLFMNPVETMAEDKDFRAAPSLLGYSVGKAVSNWTVVLGRQ